MDDERFKQVYHDSRFKQVVKKKKRTVAPVGDERFQGMPPADDDHQREIQFSKMATGEISMSSSSESSESSDEDDQEEMDSAEVALEREMHDYHAQLEVIEGATASGPQHYLEESTHRLALVNMDWDHLNAIDLMVLLSSFIADSTTGTILSVTIYVSLYGAKQLAYEQTNGPALPKTNTTNSGVDDDQQSIRQYELSRMRYYFAVAVCSDVATANVIYANCDNTEYNRSSNFLDLQFIPDETCFDSLTIRDQASEVPTSYKAPHFETPALQMTNVSVGWDLTSAARTQSLSSRYTAGDEWDDDDFNAYLASSYSSDGSGSGVEEEGGESLRYEDQFDAEAQNRKKQSAQQRVRKRYSELLGGGAAEDEEEQEDMEITFMPVLTDQYDEAKEAEEEKDMNYFEKQVRKGKRNRKAKRLEEKQQLEEQQDGVAEARTEISADQLELLMLDERGEAPSKSSAKKGKKKRKKNKKTEKQEEQIDISVDDRWKELWEKPSYGIDPTDHRFKNSETMQKLMTKVRAKTSKKRRGVPPNPASAGQRSLSSLVESLKKFNNK